MKIALSASIVLLSTFCKGHYHSAPNTNAYIQNLRSGSLVQKNYVSPNVIHSEDVNEFDDYENDDTVMTRNTIIAQKKIIKNENKNKLSFKNIEDELNKTQLYNDKNSSKNLGSAARECAVDEKGTLNMSLNSNDIFNLTPYTVELKGNSIIIKDAKTSKIVKELLYDSIKLPIETIEETRECWKVKGKKENVMFCAKTKEERDTWISNILKALFCYNTNNLTIENGKTNTLTKLNIPKKSTVNERIEKAKKKDNSTEDNTPKYVNKTENKNIEITNLESNEPSISIS